MRWAFSQLPPPWLVARPGKHTEKAFHQGLGCFNLNYISFQSEIQLTWIPHGLDHLFLPLLSAVKISLHFFLTWLPSIPSRCYHDLFILQFTETVQWGGERSAYRYLMSSWQSWVQSESVPCLLFCLL